MKSTRNILALAAAIGLMLGALGRANDGDKSPPAPYRNTPATDNPKQLLFSQPPSALPPAKAPTQIMIQCELFSVDHRKLRELGADFQMAIKALPFRATAESPSKDKPVDFLSSLVGAKMEAGWYSMVLDNTLAASALTDALVKAGAGEMLSRPRIVTLDGQEARVQVGQEHPLFIRDEVVNGERRQTIESRPVGIQLVVTPHLQQDGELRLDINAEQNRLRPANPAAIGYANENLPTLISHKIQEAVRLKPGQTAILGEFGAEEESDSPAERLLILLTPQLVTEQEQPSYAPAAPPASTAAELRALRTEVQQLRGDVARLIDLLEKDAGDSSASNDSARAPAPPNAAAEIWQRWGLRLIPAADDEKQNSSAPQKLRGMIVSGIRRGSPAEGSGIREGDRLFGLERWETTSLEDVAYVLERVDEEQARSLTFYILRDHHALFGMLRLVSSPQPSRYGSPARFHKGEDGSWERVVR